MVCVRKVYKLFIQCVCYRFTLEGVQIAYAVCVCVLQVYSLRCADCLCSVCLCVTGLLFKVCRLLMQCVFVCYRFTL